MTQFLNTDRTWNSLKIRLLLLPRKRTFKLIVAIGFICGLICIENVKQHSFWDPGQYSDKEIHISLRGWCFYSRSNAHLLNVLLRISLLNF